MEETKINRKISEVSEQLENRGAGHKPKEASVPKTRSVSART